MSPSSVCCWCRFSPGFSHKPRRYDEEAGANLAPAFLPQMESAETNVGTSPTMLRPQVVEKRIGTITACRYNEAEVCLEEKKMSVYLGGQKRAHRTKQTRLSSPAKSKLGMM